ncbi:transferrin receptor protein 2 isoform 2-T2 [Anomaloglossus baeobatrachus]|uniref:transferrin receptor protein 2 isoform X2 n=1 Tax=Anomaloglossus baeobatrachus TaxID=238106 RepID=UPI003F506077
MLLGMNVIENCFAEVITVLQQIVETAKPGQQRLLQKEIKALMLKQQVEVSGGEIGSARMPSHSYSVYRGVEEEDKAELHVEDVPRGNHRTNLKWPNLCISPLQQKILIAVILTALGAFLLGYLVTRRPCATCNINGDDFTSDKDYPQEDSEPIKMDWSEIKDLFTKYLKDGQQLKEKIGKISRVAHPAGSQENEELADYVLQAFRSYKMDHTWVESHFAELQFPNRSRPNIVNIVNNSSAIVETIPIGDPDVYSPYSATGEVEGGLLYVNYGRREDFELLRSWHVDVSASLVLLRTGHISFAEKVYNAEEAGAVGALIFSDSAETPVYGHAHLGTGDPNTPGFPSFNHTQFPPFKSSGLPKIPVQGISRSSARSLLRRLSGMRVPEMWRAPDFLSHCLGPALTSLEHKVRLSVHNVPRSVELHNVFGSITGRHEPEHYIVVGAQRDSWGPGAAKSGVGSAILLELARTMAMMVHNGFQPRRTILFVSWDGGEFGSIGATEWLEGYLSMLHLKVAAYVSLDTPVLGDENFLVKMSPLFTNLIENIIKQVDNPRQSKQSIYEYVRMKSSNWKSAVFVPLKKDSSAFAFTAFAGVPAVEFSFVENSQPYPFLDTKQDTYESLDQVNNGRLPSVATSVAEVVGLTLIKLAHDYILPLDYTAYNEILLKHLVKLQTHQKKLKARGLTLDWLYSARGDYTRATQRLKQSISLSDIQNERVIQFFNVRIMRVEFYFLSQYVSAINSPYRHILLGRGEHTLEALMEHLSEDQNTINDNELRKQIALFTWTLEGAANALSGEVWEVQRSF